MIVSLSGEQPHADWGGWENFLRNGCELRDSHAGVEFFGSSNCNYILFPTGELLENFGFHGRRVMHAIREKGWEAVLADNKRIIQEVRDALEALRAPRRAVAT